MSSDRPSPKQMVVSRRELHEPTEDERARLRNAVSRVPSAQIAADFGPIVQVCLDPEGEQSLRSEIDNLPEWDLSEDASGSMPSRKLISESEAPMVTTAGSARKVPSKLRFQLPPPEGRVARVTLTLADPLDYDDREGFAQDFLDDGAEGEPRVPLPTLPPHLMSDAVQLNDGSGIHLKYWNFTTVQSASRRVPYFSAVNIDGKKYAKSARSNNWRYDPRIPTRYQIIQECYGNESDGFFSRGHMTRREDPVWGPNAEEAEEDTFLVTNAVPQMQSHNGGLWLSLEDYVLRNAAKARQKACVITGPVLTENDPVIHGVQIPVILWKIVAFIHDETDRLAAVAYRSSQASFLPDTGAGSFVWGQFRQLQVPVARIAADTGLDFGPLEDADILRDADGSFAVAIHSEDDLLLG